ncbi:hypothetical protein STPH2_3080 [Streptomyces sp. KO7888]|nr:hypothetical protein [Streptomyces sp. KO7888]
MLTAPTSDATSAQVFVLTLRPGAALSLPNPSLYRSSISVASRRAWAMRSAISWALAWCGLPWWMSMPLVLASGEYSPLGPGPYSALLFGLSMPLLPTAVPPGTSPPVALFSPPAGKVTSPSGLTGYPRAAASSSASISRRRGETISAEKPLSAPLTRPHSTWV